MSTGKREIQAGAWAGPMRRECPFTPGRKPMASTPTTGPLNLGFLTILQDGTSYLGGYLVTNQWGRPLEFRLTSAVQPNKVQQVLYAATLVPYICGDLIG